MRALKEAWRRVTFVLRRSRLERELREEMQFHIEQRAEQLRGDGLSAEEAALAARREFGGELRLRESSSEVWGVGWIDRLKQDLRWAFRMLAKNPGFTVAALLTLSLGIGANTAIFTVVRATLIRPLPYPAAERLVWIFEVRPNFVERRTQATELTFGAWRDQARSLETIAAFSTGPSTVT
jgi:putative ABC transport system permease protein